MHPADTEAYTLLSISCRLTSKYKSRARGPLMFLETLTAHQLVPNPSAYRQLKHTARAIFNINLCHRILPLQSRITTRTSGLSRFKSHRGYHGCRQRTIPRQLLDLLMRVQQHYRNADLRRDYQLSAMRKAQRQRLGWQTAP